MRRSIRHALILATIFALVPQAPATAAPRDDPSAGSMTWSARPQTPPTSRPHSSGTAKPPRTEVPRPLTGHESSTVRAALEDDLKTACRQNHEIEAKTRDGWAKDRFQHCFLGSRTVDLLSSNGGPPVASILFDYSVLAFAYDGERRVDYVFAFDDFDTKGGDPLPETTLTVAFDGCNGSAGCSGTPAARSELVPTWKTAPNRTIQFTITSPNGTGAGTYSIIKSLVQMTMTVITARPNYLPWEETGMISSRARFDSALDKLGNGKFHGTIFSDFVPVLELDRSAASTYRAEAVHVDQALHAPVLTFPSFIGKSVPGEGNRPLHRLMNVALRDANHNASVTVCKDVWGDNYAAGGLQCDEYPFQSSYEGSYTSTNGNVARWNGSARPIDGQQNTNGGTQLSNFYGMNRVLDENMGTADEGTPSDPYLVRIVGT